ncbi:MAG: iron-sulfur cluster assembly accessory protein [Nanoarchaeota archaeon]
MSNAITEDIMIGDLVKNFPAVAEVVEKYGVHCVGCHVSEFETLGQGLRGHGMDDEQVSKVIIEVNDFVSNRNISAPKNGELLAISEVAAKKVVELAKRQGKNIFFLRASVKKGGCAGYTSSLDFTDIKKDDDTIIEAHGIKVIVDPTSQSHLDGAIIEYVESLNETGFKINNPKAKHSCACGSSFSS